MRVEDFKKTVEERKTYVEDKLNHLNQKHEYKHNLMFGNGAVGYDKVMMKNKGKNFYEDTNEGKQLEKLVIAIQRRKNELRALKAYLKVGSTYADGGEIVGYHGGGVKFNNKGITFFADNKEDAEFYSTGQIKGEPTITKGNLNIKNPANNNDLNQAIKETGATKKDIQQNSSYDGTNENDYLYVPKVIENLKEKGFDSFKGTDVLGNQEIPITVTFDSAQIEIQEYRNGGYYAKGGEIKRGIFKGYEQTKRGVLIPLQKAPIGFGVQETPKASVLIGLEFNKYDITLTNVDFDIVLIKGMVCALITQKGKRRLKVNIEKGNYTLDDVIFQLKKVTANYFNTYAKGGEVKRGNDKKHPDIVESENLIRERQGSIELLEKRIKLYENAGNDKKHPDIVESENLIREHREVIEYLNKRIKLYENASSKGGKTEVKYAKGGSIKGYFTGDLGFLNW